MTLRNEAMKRSHLVITTALLGSIAVIAIAPVPRVPPGPTVPGPATPAPPPPAKRPATAPAPNLWAIVIGIDHYADAELPDLPGAAKAARDVRNWLVRDAGWDAGHVLSMERKSQHGHEGPEKAIADLYPTRENLDWATKVWLGDQVQPDDVVLIYFAGRAVDRGPASDAPGSPRLLPFLKKKDGEKDDRPDPAGWSIAEAIDSLAAKGQNPILVCLDLPPRDAGRGPIDPPGFVPDDLGWWNDLARWPCVTCLCAEEEGPGAVGSLAVALTASLGDLAHPRNLLGGLDRLKQEVGRSARRFRVIGGLDSGLTLWPGRGDAPGRTPLRPLGHSNRVSNVAVSRAGDLMISGGADSMVKAWRVAGRTLQLRDVLPRVDMGVTGLALSDDGLWLAIGDGAGHIRIGHRKTTIQMDWTVSDPAVQPPHDGAVVRLAFLPGEARLASLDSQGKVLLWEATAHGLLRTPLSRPLLATDLACGPGRIAVAASGPDGTTALHLFGADGALLAELKGPGGTVYSGRLALAGKRGEILAAADDEGRVVVWDVGDPGRIKEVDRFAVPGEESRELSLAPPTLALGGGQAVHLRFLDRPEAPIRLPAADGVDQVLLSDDGLFVAACTEGGEIQAWDVSDRVHPKPMPLTSGVAAGAVSAAFGHEGRFLVAGCRDGSIRTWDLPSGKESVVPGRREGAAALSVATDGRSLLQITGDQQAQVWDLSKGRASAPLAGRWTSGFLLADGRSLLMTDDHGDVALVDRASGRRPEPNFPRPMTQDGNGVVCWDFGRVAASPDGRWIAAGCTHGPLACVWDARGELVREIRHRDQDVTAVGFSADSRWLLTAGRDGTARAWDLNAQEDRDRPRWTFTAGGDDGVSGVTAALIVPTVTVRVVTGHADGRVILWEIGLDDQPAATLLGNLAGEVRALATAPDGRWLAAAGDDPAVRFWSLDAARPATMLLPLPHAGRIEALVVWPDGRRIAAGDSDGTVRLWDLGNPGPP